MAVEPGLEGAAGGMAGQAVLFRLVLVEDLVRDHLAGGDFPGCGIRRSARRSSAGGCWAASHGFRRSAAASSFPGRTSQTGRRSRGSPGRRGCPGRRSCAGRSAFRPGASHAGRGRWVQVKVSLRLTACTDCSNSFSIRLAFLEWPVAAGGGRVLGVGGVRVLVVAFVVAFGARQALVVSAFEGLRVFQDGAQGLQVQAFFWRVCQPPPRCGRPDMRC